jgi:hypothetical protein
MIFTAWPNSRFDDQGPIKMKGHVIFNPRRSLVIRTAWSPHWAIDLPGTSNELDDCEERVPMPGIRLRHNLMMRLRHQRT